MKMKYVINTMYNDNNIIVKQVSKWKNSYVGYHYATFRNTRTDELIVLTTFEIKMLENIQEGDYCNI